MPQLPSALELNFRVRVRAKMSDESLRQLRSFRSSRTVVRSGLLSLCFLDLLAPFSPHSFSLTDFKHKKSIATIAMLFIFAWRRPTLTGAMPQLPSALKSLTSVFGMGTGVSSSPSSPNSR
jgi:hypothetical protein